MPETAPGWQDLLADLGPGRFADVLLGIEPVDVKGRYLHWDEMLRRTPPDGLTHEEWWSGTRFSRQALARPLPLSDADGRAFTFSNIDAIQEMVHRIDQQASGQISSGKVVTDLRSSDRYLVSSLIEEAITSSKLEGASTTRKVAKEMLISGRAPRDRSEQMIANNYQAMVFAQEMVGRPLTPTDVLDLHRIVTDGTLDDPADAGRLQAPGEERIGVWWDDVLVYSPPPAEQLPERLERLCEFANGDGSYEGFMHPVVRATLIHLWLACDHPFVDGNGRTSRALFYWSMLSQGYWLTQYISVSNILRKAPKKYTMSFVYAETDRNDATYFVIYQLKVIEQAISSLYAYLERKMHQDSEIEQLIRGSSRVNHRQLPVLQEALSDPGRQFTFASHARLHRVTNQSARNDLLGLESLGLLVKGRVGRQHVFTAAPDLASRLRSLGGG